jgi:hypothetical protein
MSEIVREDQDQFTGKRGERIAVGDFVAAAIREGNSATLKVGRVQRIYHQKGPYSWQSGYRVQILFNGASRVSTMENTYNITKIEDQCQCTGSCYSGPESPPERCADFAGHEGECAP